VLTPPIALESGIDFVARENRSRQPGSALMLRRLTIYSVAVGNSCDFDDCFRRAGGRRECGSVHRRNVLAG
jgi:hypothetical protein